MKINFLQLERGIQNKEKIYISIYIILIFKINQLKKYNFSFHFF